jgi:hypothetical protein
MRPASGTASHKCLYCNELRLLNRAFSASAPGGRQVRELCGWCYFFGRFDTSELQRRQRFRCGLTLPPHLGQRIAFSLRTNLLRGRVLMAGRFLADGSGYRVGLFAVRSGQNSPIRPEPVKDTRWQALWQSVTRHAARGGEGVVRSYGCRCHRGKMEV